MASTLGSNVGELNKAVNGTDRSKKSKRRGTVGEPRCEHGRLYNCLECGGGGICEHKRRRRECRPCLGLPPLVKKKKENRKVPNCVHGKSRLGYHCGECKRDPTSKGGGGMCQQHPNSRKHSCSICKPFGAYCGHRIRKGNCPDCRHLSKQEMEEAFLAAAVNPGSVNQNLAAAVNNEMDQLWSRFWERTPQ